MAYLGTRCRRFESCHLVPGRAWSQTRSGPFLICEEGAREKVGIFFSSSLQAGPGAKRAPGSFLICAEAARVHIDIFFSISLQKLTEF